MRVLYLTNIPSPYMVGYLNELGKYCELQVVFEKAFDSTRPDSWKKLLVRPNFNYSILAGKSIDKKLYGDKLDSAPDDKALSFEVVKHINRNYDFIIVANPCTPTGIIEILYMQFHKIPYSIQSEGGYPGNGKGIKEKIKYYLMRKAEYYFSTCDLDDAYFIQYGATKDRIRRYPFASICEADLPKESIGKEERNRYKKMLGISDKLMILSVGRSVHVKGFDILLQALKGISQEVCTYFVGGKCISEYNDIIEKEQLSNIFFIDNVDYKELKKYYYAADIFVLPTRSDTWGLVINEAMTYAIPVITTDRCVAGNALIKDGVNGYIVKTENVEQLRDALVELMSDEKKRYQFGEYSYKVMRDWTFETMGKTVFKHIQEIVRGTDKNDFRKRI